MTRQEQIEQDLDEGYWEGERRKALYLLPLRLAAAALSPDPDAKPRPEEEK